MTTFTNKAYDLTGRTAVITGAAGLLGPQHAVALLTCGARVIATDVDLAGAERTADELGRGPATGRIVARRLDVTDADGIAALARELESEDGVDILVNNAAIDPKVKPGSGLEPSRFENLSIEDWNFQIAVGLTGAFLCSQTFGAAMAARGGGAILNIASDLSVIAPDQRLYRTPGLPDDRQPVKPVTYSVIKTALIGLTRYLATYWAEQNVRVNALSPGGIYTGQPEDFVRRLSDLIPLGRMAEKNEYRAVVQFLCSDASKYMTGQNIVVDGGRTVL